MCDGEEDSLLTRLRAHSTNASSLVLDLRDGEAFQARRLARAHNIPAPQLPQRLFELPPKTQPFTVVAPDGRGAHWSAWFEGHGWHVRAVLDATAALWRAAEAEGAVEAGKPRRTLLFEPCPLLRRFAAHVESSVGPGEVTTCLDVGCGSGRDMIFLAARGWTCLGLDNWAAAVRRARTAATTFALPDRISAERVDIAADGTLTARPCPGCPEAAPAFSSIDDLKRREFNLVLIVRFLNRALVPQLRRWVAPRGFLLFSTFLDDPQAPEEVARRYPQRPDHRLHERELREWFSPEHGFGVVCDEVHSLDDGRKVTHFLAQRLECSGRARVEAAAPR